MRKEEAKKRLAALLSDAAPKRLPSKRIGLLFSGGIDSALLAFLMKQSGIKFTCYTTVFSSSPVADLIAAKKAAAKFGVELEIVRVSLEEIENEISHIVDLIESSSPLAVGVALVFYFAIKKAREQGIKVIFSGMGADELFAGYASFQESKDINKDCRAQLRKLRKNDLPRDSAIAAANNIELRTPYLDKKFIAYSLQIPGKYKLGKKANKLILRELALDLGLGREIAFRKKKAAQYGSAMDKAIKRLAKEKGFKRKSAYLDSLSRHKGLALGALVSSGKDSLYATYLMQKKGHAIKCLIAVESKNPDSYMFHTPNVHLVKLQAKALGIPVVVAQSKGEKEKELQDLKRAIAEAKKKFNLQGIVGGALYSNYQRSRIEAVATQLGLKVFTPIWHKNQAELLKELLRQKFQFIITAIACQGLNAQWLGKKITEKNVDELIALSRKFSFNAAGEGGEFETLVLSAPNFKQRIEILQAEKEMQNEFTGRLKVKKARLDLCI